MNTFLKATAATLTAIAIGTAAAPAPTIHDQTRRGIQARVNDGATLIKSSKAPHGRTPDSARKLAQLLTSRSGWDRGKEWRCLNELWTHESGFRYRANNPTSTAQGIPQILKLPADTSPADQIKRGAKYIKHRYGTPCKAWQAWKERGFQLENGDWRGGWY